jgi:cysteine desulfurase
MAGARAYLDYNASAPLLASAREAMIAALDVAAMRRVAPRGG